MGDSEGNRGRDMRNLKGKGVVRPRRPLRGGSSNTVGSQWGRDGMIPGETASSQQSNRASTTYNTTLEEEEFIPETGDGLGIDIDNQRMIDRDFEEMLDDTNIRNAEFLQRKSTSASNTGFVVQVARRDGGKSEMRLDVPGLARLEMGHRVIVPWSLERDQPEDEGGALYNRYISSLGRQWNLFPINFNSWDQIPQSKKDDVFEHYIQRRFLVRFNKARYTYLRMGESWKVSRNRLFHKMSDGTETREQLQAKVPDGVPPDQWAGFVAYRKAPQTQEVSQRNRLNRAQQDITHTCGSRSMSVRYSQMQKKARENNTEATYVDLYKATHRRKDNTPLSDAAEAVIRRMEEADAEIQRESQESQSSVDPLAAFRAGLARDEHTGRCRGLGLGATPSRLYGRRKDGSGSSRRHMMDVDDMTEEINERLRQQNQVEMTQMRETMRTELRTELRDELRDEMRQEMQAEVDVRVRQLIAELKSGMFQAPPPPPPPES